jgi:hypothetical protein
MLDTFRNKRMMAATRSAGIVGIATIIGSGVAAADPKATEVKLQNKSGVALEVTITDGDAMLKKKGSIEFAAGDARSIGTVPDGTTLKWVATPKRDDDKNRFTGCKGDKKVSGSKDTIVIEEKNCNKSSAAAPPKIDQGGGSAKSNFTDVKFINTLKVAVHVHWFAPNVSSDESLSAGEADNQGTLVEVDEKGKYSLTVMVEFYAQKKKAMYPCGTSLKKYINSARTIKIVPATDPNPKVKGDEYGDPNTTPTDCKLEPATQ